MTGPRRRARGARIARASALALLGLVAALAPHYARAQTPAWEYDHDMRVTYEYDDNVNEELINPARAQVARLSYSSDVRWNGAGEQRLSLTYQGGFKRHFGLVTRDSALSEGGEIASQLVNEGTIAYDQRVAPAISLGGSIGVKNRTWTDDFFFINEDGFTRWNAGGHATFELAPLAEGSPARLELGGRWSTLEFKNLDGLFGNDVLGGHVSLAKQFGEDVTLSWTYALDRVRYPGRGIIRPTDDNVMNAFTGTSRPRQEDRLHELGAEVTWLSDFTIAADYRFRYNDSNSFGLSYLSHNFGLQVLRRLPWDLLVQFYGQIELRAFSEPVPNLAGAGSLDTGEAANNVFLVRLVKDLTADTSIEARYGRYRNESVTLNDFYTKNIYAVGMNYRP